MMLAKLTPSPATPAASGAAVPAPAPGADAPAAVPPAPGAAATPFASWLAFDAPLAASDGSDTLTDTDTDTGEQQGAPVDALAGLVEAPALALPAGDSASTPAMTMSAPFGMSLPLGIMLAQAMPAGAPVNAAPGAGIAPPGASAAATSFAAPPLAPAAQPQVTLAAPQAALPAATVPFSLGASAPAAQGASASAAAPAPAPAPELRSPAPVPAASVAAPALAAALSAAMPGARAAVRSGEAAPASTTAPAQKATLATAAQPFAPAAESAVRSDVPLSAGASIMAGSNALAAQQGGMAAQPDVKLPASPADWQQPLREALGERLQLQLGNKLDQAVIRLDPPQLGRIEIAIRHAAGGALEVNISASHSEVRRQLNNVSDAMRSDLAQRQFSDVAVTISATPRSGAAFGDQQGQGRGRQPERETHDNDPGRALSEAGQPAATFSLSGREAAA
jgi:flagellar hook-length control protein FliK